MIQRNIFAEDYLEKLDREAQELASEQERQDWKFNSFLLKKKRERERERFGLEQIATQF